MHYAATLIQTQIGKSVICLYELYKIVPFHVVVLG